MSPTTQTAFDIQEYKRGYEEWDIDALVALYDDDIEQIQLDVATPPSSPGIRRGKERMRQMFEHCASRGVKATVENTVPGDERAAATVTCEFPDGRKVVCNSILELRAHKIVREHVVGVRE